MITISRIAVAGAIALSSITLATPTAAYAASPGICTGDYELAKLVKQGTTTKDLAGAGNVQVKVQVNADGSHQVMGVDKSTNPGDNDAATDIAANSTYKPASCNGKPQPSFYNFHLKFNGAKGGATNSASSGSTGPIEAAIKAGHYDDAISKANAALLASPGDQGVLQLLAIAQYYNKQSTDSAATFSKVSAVGKNFQGIAASAFAEAAVTTAASNPADALGYANKAVQMANNNNSRFALGVAQIANKDYPSAITTLKDVRSKVSDKTTDLAIDRQLLSAYLAQNDSAGIASTKSDMDALDSTGTAASSAIAAHFIEAGQAAMNAKNFADAEKAFDQAIKGGASGGYLVTAATEASFAELSMQKPDFSKAAAYGEKAVAADGTSPEANYAAGVSYGNLYASSKKADDKTKALGFLNKADQLAKAAGKTSLSLQIEQQIKTISQ